jgi:peptidoglycan glycosyltransferase
LEPQTLAEAYQLGCPGPIAEIAISLGPERFNKAVLQWELDLAPKLELPAEAVEWRALAADCGSQVLTTEALGQGSLVLSPLRVALIAATLGAEGEMPVPTLVRRTQDRVGRWQVPDPPSARRRVIPPSIADEVIGAWMSDDEGRVRSRSGAAIGGEDKPPHGWYTGVATAPDKTYAIAVLVEHADDERQAASVGLSLFGELLPH